MRREQIKPGAGGLSGFHSLCVAGYGIIWYYQGWELQIIGNWLLVAGYTGKEGKAETAGEATKGRSLRLTPAERTAPSRLKAGRARPFRPPVVEICRLGWRARGDYGPGPDLDVAGKRIFKESKNMGKRYSIGEEKYGKTIKELQEIIRSEPRIVFAYLHGSFIEKSNFGDLDLAFFLAGRVHEREFILYEIDFARLITQKVFYPADVRILNNAPPSFCYAVIKKGIRLVDNDENKRVEFEMQTYRSYFDFLPFRRRYLKEALKGEI